MLNYFLSHVFDKENEGAPGDDAGDQSAGDQLGKAPAGDPPAGDADKEKPPKPPKERSRDDVVNDRFAELTRKNTEAAALAARERTRAEKAERELQAAHALLARAPKAGDTPPPNVDDAPPLQPAQRPPPFRPVVEERSINDILNSEEGRAAIAKQAAAERAAADISARGDEIYERAVAEFGQSKVTKALSNFKIFDGIKPELAEAVFELGDDAPAVLMEIASKPAIIEKLYAATPARMGAMVAALATTVKKPAISKVGEPPGEMGGRGNAGPADLTSKDTPMADWVRTREEDLKRRGVRL
jgi:hypothetical protein